jgi:osmotically inducible lipoprotein OsmB
MQTHRTLRSNRALRGALVLMLGTALLAGCGNRPGERALSGGGIGAGVGAVGAAVVGAPVLGGALIGGAVGAATGALTDKDDINLGD